MEKITAETIKALIAQKYSEDKYATFFELRSGTGAMAGSAIDAFVMNVWPSEKFTRYAFEIKISRQDMMHELNHPKKRQWSFDMSNEFWFVCAPGIVKPDEIPENCGLLVVSKNGRMLRSLKRAQWREVDDLKMHQAASIIRAASRMQKYPETLIWLRAGEEINIEEIDQIIRARRSEVDESDIKHRVATLVKDKFDKQNADMGKYAQALQEAGIDPPDFMTNPHGYVYDGTIKHWIEKYFVVGPDIIELRRAMEDLKRANHAVKSAEEAIVRISKRDVADDDQLPIIHE